MDLSTVDERSDRDPSIFTLLLPLLLDAGSRRLLPKMRREVCLSAPVVSETGEDSAKTICTVN